MLNQLNKIHTIIQENQTILLLVTTVILIATSIFGIGFKNSLLSAFVIIIFLILLNPSFNFKNKKTIYLLLSFMAFFILSQFFRQTPYGFHEFINLSLGGLLAIFMTSSFKSLQLPKYTNWLSYLLLPISIIAILMLFFGPTDRAFGPFIGAEPFTTYPNAYADLLLFSISLSFHQILQKNETKLIHFAFTINLITFFLTFSRAAYLSLFVSLVCIFIFHIVSKIKSKTPLKKFILKSIKLVIIGVFSLLLAGGVSYMAEYGTNISDRLVKQDISSSRSASERPSLWKGALQITSDYPIFGTGSGSFSFLYPKYQNSLLSNAPHPHNLFLKLSSENGLITAILLLSIVITALIPYKLTPKFLGVWGALIGFIIHNLLDYNLNFPILSFLFFLTIGLLLSRFNNLNHKKSTIVSFFVLILLTTITLTTTLQLFGYINIKKLSTNDYLSLPQNIVNAAKIAPFPHQLYSLCSDPFSPQPCYISTDSYPIFHPNIYGKVLNNIHIQNILSPTELTQTTAKLLELNYYNDLNYHLLHLVNLAPEERLNYEQNIYDLLQDYVTLLNVNTHNTVASSNPQATHNVIQVYKQTPNSQLNKWENLEKRLQKVYKTESNKFQARFGYQLSELQYEPIQDLNANS